LTELLEEHTANHQPTNRLSNLDLNEPTNYHAFGQPSTTKLLNDMVGWLMTWLVCARRRHRSHPLALAKGLV